MLRLDNDIKSLQSFANRAYTNELAIQKTVLRDLLGGMPLFYPPIHPQLHTNKDLPHSQENKTSSTNPTRPLQSRPPPPASAPSPRPGRTSWPAPSGSRPSAAWSTPSRPR
jgi:hypothetical protein